MSNVPPPPPENPNAPPQGSPQPPQGSYQQAPYGAPPPPPGAYAQPGQYQQAGYPDGGFQNLQINLWLSVFFSWIPALIFYLIDKDKTTDPIRRANIDNFNFQLIRLIVGLAAWVLALIPFVGWILALILWLASVALFVIAIVHAVQVPNAIRNGQPARYIFTVNWVK